MTMDGSAGESSKLKILARVLKNSQLAAWKAIRPYPTFRIGDRVVKNPDGWISSEFDWWGAGEGVGVVVNIWQDAERCEVDVRWPAGRAWQKASELLWGPEFMVGDRVIKDPDSLLSSSSPGRFDFEVIGDVFDVGQGVVGVRWPDRQCYHAFHDVLRIRGVSREDQSVGR